MRNPSKNTIKRLLKKAKDNLPFKGSNVVTVTDLDWYLYYPLTNRISSITKGKLLFIIRET